MNSPQQSPVFQPLWANDLDASASNMRWLWQGFLAPGMITLLTSQSKCRDRSLD